MWGEARRLQTKGRKGDIQQLSSLSVIASAGNHSNMSLLKRQQSHFSGSSQGFFRGFLESFMIASISASSAVRIFLIGRPLNHSRMRFNIFGLFFPPVDLGRQKLPSALTNETAMTKKMRIADLIIINQNNLFYRALELFDSKLKMDKRPS